MDRPTFISSVIYDDPHAALKWLEEAFGFETTTLVTDAEGKLAHSEMSFGNGAVTIGGPWTGAPFGPARSCSPASTGGAMTQFLRVHLDDGLDAHCERARAAGARIVAEPEEQFYGSRVYRAMDPEGHVWNFSQEIRVVPKEEAEAATGLKIQMFREPDHG
jgi:uncharacterized glyoxalase superfamily protein PhnB